jgi:superfamily II DNA or RNA helicase
VACAQLWIAGVDVPEIDAVIWLRPTASLTAWLQGNGRGLRIAPGKRDLLVLDHVGNCARLGHPLTVHEWSLDGTPKRDREAAPSVKVCPACFSAMPSAARECPDCGHEFIAERRELQHVDGELVEIGGLKVGDLVETYWGADDGWFDNYKVVEIRQDCVVVEALQTNFICEGETTEKRHKHVRPSRKAAKREQAQANTLEELIAIGRRRNMKNPAGWARHVMAARSLRSGKARVRELVA